MADDDSLAVQRYGVVMSYLQYENTIFWTRSWFFLVAHTALFAICVRLFVDPPTNHSAAILSTALSGLGLYLAVVWWSALRRAHEWIDRWVKVLRELESAAFGDIEVMRGIPDSGPHLLGSHFTRDVMYVVVIVFAVMWGSALGASIYRLGMLGAATSG